MTTHAYTTGWSGLDLKKFGMLDTRGVEVIGEQVFVSDGYDFRSSTDPMNHAIFVFDVTGPASGPAPTASFTASATSGTAPLNVQFTDTSTGAPTSWAWTFGDGGTSTSQSPSHSYAAGTFTATLTATNANGSTSASKTISVTSAPVKPTAAFTASATTGTAPLSVNFTDSSTGVPTSWAWDFGDSGSSTSQNPSHTFTTNGTYVVRLTATNAHGSTSASKTITVADAPPPPTTVPLDADAYFNTSSPTKNYATATVLKLHNPTSAEYRPIVKFTLSGFSGPPASVKLRLFVVDGSVDCGSWFKVDNGWTETGVIWNNKPVVSGSPAGIAGACTTGTWVDVDVTSAITGNGTYSFEATSTSTNTAEFSSREGTNPPQVVIVP
jgi:PKD repeat protein